jgi:hypothetical protein
MAGVTNVRWRLTAVISGAKVVFPGLQMFPLGGVAGEAAAAIPELAIQHPSADLNKRKLVGIFWCKPIALGVVYEVPN